jgi:hypothetical protein
MLTSDDRLELVAVHDQLKVMRQIVDGLENALGPLWYKLFAMEKEMQDRLITEYLVQPPHQGEPGLEANRDE